MKVRTKTYEIDLNEMEEYFIEWFANLDATPLPIRTLNGVRAARIGNTGIQTKYFPNPITTKMLMNLCHGRGGKATKFATTIVEYHDKKGQPIVYLYPDGQTNVSVDNLPATMNHQMRRSLAYQIKLRQNMIAKTK